MKVSKAVNTCGECYFFNSREPLKPGQHFAICPRKPAGTRPWVAYDQPACIPATKSTLPPMDWDLLDGPDVVGERCAVCGRPATDKHHPAHRDRHVYGADGKPAHNPVISLCGAGNVSGCHGKAHAGRLHFRTIGGEWEYLETSEPMKRARALELDGWRPLGGME